MSEIQGTVPGEKDQVTVKFYGLSTCIWCKRTRQFLEREGIAFDYFYVDKLKGQEREDIIEEVRCWNTAVSFPTLVIGKDQCVVGYKPEQIKEKLGL